MTKSQPPGRTAARGPRRGASASDASPAGTAVVARKVPPDRDPPVREADGAASPAAPCPGCPLDVLAREEGRSVGALLAELVAAVREDHRAVEAMLADLAARPATGPARGRGEAPADGDLAELLGRLTVAVGRRLDELDAVAAAEGGAGAERDSKTIQTLAKTLETLEGLRRDAAGGDDGRKDIDLDLVRAEIASRLDRLGAAG